MKHRLKFSILLVSLITIFFGCSFLREGGVHSDLSKTAQVWLRQTAAIEVEEVYHDEHQLYIKYNVMFKDSDVMKAFFGRVVWEEYKGEDEDDAVELRTPRNFVSSIEFIGKQNWMDRSQDLRSVKTLSHEHWIKFHQELARVITPEFQEGAKQFGQGVVIRQGEEEILFYYDGYGQLQAVDVKQKPRDVRIKMVYTQEQFTEVILSTLETYLKTLQWGDTKHVLLTMGGQYDEAAMPFLYVDLEQRLAVSLRVQSASGVPPVTNGIGQTLKSADYIIRKSHVMGIMTRPFSSAFRLFAWGKGAVTHLIKPPRLRILERKMVPELTNGPQMDIVVFEKKLDKIVGKNVSEGTIDFLIGGDQYFPRLIEALVGARKSIDLRIFIFDNDDYAVKIADLLKRKSRQKDIEIKVLLDGIGQIMGEGAMPDSLPIGFLPPSSMDRYLREDSDIQVRVRPDIWMKADHIKTITIDNEVCFTGGMNIGREYRYHWHDFMMAVRGPIVSVIAREFNGAWAYAGSLGDIGFLNEIVAGASVNVEKINERQYPIRLLFTRGIDPQIFHAQIAAIRASRKYIYIHNAYLSDDTILHELIYARQRGVDVRVILPVNGNHQIMNASNVVTANTMFKNGIRVFFYPGMTHVKAAIYDGWLCVGSANFDRLSLRDNMEFNLAISDPQTVQHVLDALFIPDFKKSKEMNQPLESGWKEFLAELLAEQL